MPKYRTDTVESKQLPRVSQRLPQACQECTRRKVRCNKQIPCSRCSRLGKPCSREHVYTTKTLRHGNERDEELRFLQSLKSSLSVPFNLDEISEKLDRRIADLHGTRLPPLQTQLPASSSHIPSSHGKQVHHDTSPATPTSPSAEPPATIQNASDSIRALESQVWSRHSSVCYPHRRECKCVLYRSYSELASINSDLSSSALKWTYYQPDVSIFLATDDAKKVITFHIDYLWWHHNSLHSTLFLEHCDKFWSSGIIVHPLWLALYLSILSSTLWSLINSPKHAQALDLDIDLSVIERQYKKMIQILYAEDYLQNPSSEIHQLQQFIIATRFAHNIGFSSSVTNMLNSVIGIAQFIGLHRIRPAVNRHDPSTPAQSRNQWHESVEIEVGKRTWWQLVIQDHFAIPFTNSFFINPSQHSTPLPLNCNDDDLMEHDDKVITTSSYTRCVSQECLLMPRLLQGFKLTDSSISVLDRYSHVLRLDQEMRSLVSSFPRSLLKTSSDSNAPDPKSSMWLPTARRTLAISAADKIIMIHRPVMYRALRSPNFPETRATCLSAAVTILKEHERTADEELETVSIWTQTAFCTSAATVLGLELLYGSVHASSNAAEYRQLLSRAALRLRKCRLDTMASRCVSLIEVFLAADAEATNLAAGDRQPPEIQLKCADELVQSQQILLEFLSSSQANESVGSIDIYPKLETKTDVAFASLDDAGGFESWYNSIFTQTGL